MNTAFDYRSDPDDGSDLPPLPLRVLSRDGTVVETRSSLWRISGADFRETKWILDWNRLDQVGEDPLLTRRACHLLKLYMADRLSKKKAATVYRNYNSFLSFSRWLTTHTADLALSPSQGFHWSDLNEGRARAYLQWAVKHTAEKGNDFFTLRTFYEWGIARGYADFQHETLRQLKSIKAPGNAKGHHVRFRHPTKGPFSPDELLLIRKAVQAEKGTDHERAVVMLHLELGLNPYASCQITNADLKRYETQQVVTYQIDVPRVKKRTIHRETKRRPISHELGHLLEGLQQGESEDLLLHWLAPSHPERTIRQIMRSFVKAAGIISPHTGMLLLMTPRRLRTSLATHMAAQGASKFHIAEILDHTDLQNVSVYTQTVSTIADQVARATDPLLQPLVKRFLGTIVEIPETQNSSDQQIIPALAPHIPLPMLNAGGIGLCGKDIQKEVICRLLPPFSCYLCPCFVAFRSGPHQELLNSLLTFGKSEEEREGNRMVRQLDDVCIAIAEVLAQLDLPSSCASTYRLQKGNEA